LIDLVCPFYDERKKEEALIEAVRRPKAHSSLAMSDRGGAVWEAIEASLHAFSSQMLRTELDFFLTKREGKGR